jgi:hypothetical protein
VTEPNDTGGAPRRRTQTLGVILGLLDGAKKQANAAVTALHRQSSDRARFDGLTREYRPDAVADGAQLETLPGEHKLVELTAERQVRDLAGALHRRLDLQLTMDTADTTAFGDVRVPDGSGGERVLIAHVPATTLLVMTKILEDVRTFIRNLPVQDPAKEWHADPNADGVYVTDVTETVRNKKTPKVLLKAAATERHQADTEVYWIDERAGVWQRVERTGALPPNRYGALLERVELLLNAVRTAREEANQVVAPDRRMGYDLFSYLLDGRLSS